MSNIGRPKLPAAEKKIVVSTYVSQEAFKKIAIGAIRNKTSISKHLNALIERGMADAEAKS